MTIPFVDLHAQYFALKTQLDAAIAAVIRESTYIRGPHVDAFERAWAGTIGVRHCISCANGTDALYIALRALALQPGDEVITTAHSWISTAETITQAGGRVAFCDTDATYTIDPEAIAARITPRTVGIIPVHLYGQPCAMDAILDIARSHSLWVIEDCAQAHLATYKGRMVGTFGAAAAFSFYPGKNLGAYGDAGCIVTNNDSLAQWMATFARHGGKGEHVMEGINSRLDGLQAAILNVKLSYLAAATEARRTVARRYSELLAGVGDLLLPTVAVDREHVWHLFVIQSGQRDALQAHLAAAGIATVINYPKALPFYPAYAYLRHQPEDFPVAHSHQSRILSLPLYPEMSEEMIEYVVGRIRGFFDGRAPTRTRPDEIDIPLLQTLAPSEPVGKS